MANGFTKKHDFPGIDFPKQTGVKLTQQTGDNIDLLRHLKGRDYVGEGKRNAIERWEKAEISKLRKEFTDEEIQAAVNQLKARPSI